MILANKNYLDRSEWEHCFPKQDKQTRNKVFVLELDGFLNLIDEETFQTMTTFVAVEALKKEVVCRKNIFLTKLDVSIQYSICRKRWRDG